MTSLLAVNAPVLGLNLSFVDDTYSGKLPEDDVFQTGYITAFVVVSSVVPVFVAFVAVVADVAVLAFPVSAPTNVVLVTDVNPAIVVAVPPKLTAVEPMVMDELVSAALGMLVRLAPEPLNVVAANSPLLGVYCSLVELVYSVEILPLVWLANRG